jgi:hypothetical protein
MQFSPLANPLASAAQLEVSGSQLDGIPPDLEDSVRYAGARLTQAAGALLRLPQEVIAQAIIVFMRFWVGTEGGSMVEFGAGVSTISPGARSCTSTDSATASIGFLTLPRHKAVRISQISAQFNQRLCLSRCIPSTSYTFRTRGKAGHDVLRI